MPSNSICRYIVICNSDEFIFPTNDTTSYICVKYENKYKMFGYYYKKKDNYIRFPVKLSVNGLMVHCSCKRVNWVPGTNSGNVTLGISITLGEGFGADRYETFKFSWVMKDGIDESKPCSIPYYPYYLGSGFTTQSSWELDNGDGNKTYYIFDINRDSIPSPPHG